MVINKIYHENCLDTLSRIPDNFVDLTVTSPPYDDMDFDFNPIPSKVREYKGYTWNFKQICQELYRATKPGGVCVWVVGDIVVKRSESLASSLQKIYFRKVGWFIHDTMIYQKNGTAYPASAKSNRYSQVFEYMFVFSKGVPKTCNLIKDKLNRWAGETNFGNNSERLSDGRIKQRKKKGQIVIGEYGYRENIWRINNGHGWGATDPYAEQHPATFPESLAHDHILTWSNPGDLIYDPFSGAGTTAKMAKYLGRHYLASEISFEYFQLSQKRLEKTVPKAIQTSLI